MTIVDARVKGQIANKDERIPEQQQLKVLSMVTVTARPANKNSLPSATQF